MLDPQRTIAELKELRALTGDADGAQRLAWTPTWAAARAWLRPRLEAIPGATVHTDAAGNVWTTLAGASERALLIGGHIDSVANGGWLDGCLNVVAGLEVLRRIAADGTPPVTVRLVDWADEEGSRFSRSLFGSSAASGFFDPEELAELKDRDGVTLAAAVGAFGVDLRTAREAGRELKNAAAYLELHIEQGPVLERLNLPLGAVIGTYGVERHAVTFSGQMAHAGSTPMDQRRDALGPVSKLHMEIREIARRHGGVCTIGSVKTWPGIVTAVVGRAEITLDQRNMDPARLALMLQEAKDASARFAAEEGCTAEWNRIWRIEPIRFNEQLVALCEQANIEVAGQSHRLPSGPLHDAAEVARSGVPTVMLFVQSLRGLSHNKDEDTLEEHLALCVQALDRLADKTIGWIKR